MIAYAILLPPGQTPFHHEHARKVPMLADTVLTMRKRFRRMGIEIKRVWGHNIDGSRNSTAWVELRDIRALM